MIGLKSTTKLSEIINLYCTDYIQLLPENPTNEDHLEARYKSYKHLLRKHDIDSVTDLCKEMTNEIRTCSITNRENTRILLYNIFDIINYDNKQRPSEDDWNEQTAITLGETFELVKPENEIKSITLIMGYSIISKVTKTVKRLIYELTDKKSELEIQESKTKRFGAKYYALLHKIKINLGIENDFIRNQQGDYIKKLIVDYAVANYGFEDGQSFYRAFLDKTDISDKTLIAKNYGDGYKEKLIRLSNNDHRVIQELKNYPN